MMKPRFTGEYIAFSPFDRVALANLIRRVGHPNCRMAEIGSWLGNGSTQVFLRELVSFPGSALVCIDHWRGNANVKRHQDIVADFDVFATFRGNVDAERSPVKMLALVSSSADAASLIADESFDLVFIDADHGYQAVKDDIAAWRPKVRPGGMLCGHDCEAHVTADNGARFSAAATIDVISGDGTPFPEIHPGSIMAVHEAFDGRAELWADREIEAPDGCRGRSTIWFYPVPAAAM